mgnify:FL=1|jgi:hypothetical protein
MRNKDWIALLIFWLFLTALGSYHHTKQINALEELVQELVEREINE